MDPFAEFLNELTTDALRALIEQRPDAFNPAPPSLATLAQRLSLRTSVTYAIQHRNAQEIAALEALGDAGAELSPVDATALGIHADVLATLRSLALIYGTDTETRVAPGALNSLPQGWRLTDPVPENLDAVMESIDAPQRRILQSLATAGGVGTTQGAALDTDPTSPIARLVSSGLLIRVNENTVRLPRAVRDIMRGTTPRVIPTTPPPAPTPPDQQHVDEHAAGQGLDSVRKMRQLLLHLLRTPVALNKDGTVGVRALKQLDKALGFDPALIITVGEAAGLVGRTHHDDQDILAVTNEALTWLDAPQFAEWALLIAGWMASPWRTDLVSQHRLLSEEMHQRSLRNARFDIVRLAGEHHLERLLFESPLRAAGYSPELIDATLAEAHAIGAVAPATTDAAPYPSTPLFALIDNNDVTETTRALVPQEATYLIAQGDMTVLVPGPLSPEMGRVLESFADLESPGLASVWRISEDSLRRAFNSGLSAESLHAWLEHYVVGEVPQAITFIIDDIARTHGSIRAGNALSYVRSSDPALITTAAQRTTLQVLAPTVAVSQLPLQTLLKQLRDAGLQPTAEDEHGAQLAVTPDPILAKATPSRLLRERGYSEADVEKIVAALMHGPTETGEQHSAETNALETLKAAARARRHVKLGYVNKNGQGKTLTVLPLTVHAGQVDVFDEASERVVRISLARITNVVLA